MGTKEKKRTVYRDSVNGRFITVVEAFKRPKTTEKQRVRIKPLTRNKTTGTSNQGESI